MKEFDGVELSIKDISVLKNAIASIDKITNDNLNLFKKIKVKNKFIGVLGEAIGLILVFNKYGPSYKYRWYGGFKKGYDLVISKDGKETKIQIKSSSGDEFSFRVLSIENIPSNVIKQVKQQNYSSFLKLMDINLDNSNADKWLFVDVPHKTGFLTGIKTLKKALRDSYISWIKNTKHGKKFNYGIKNNKLSFILTESCDKEFFERFEKITY